MIFVPIDRVCKNMVLARDIKIYSYDLKNIDLLKKGLKLSLKSIDRLKHIGYSGIYVYEDNEKTKTLEKPKQILNTELREKAIDNIEKLFQHIDNNDKVNDILLENVNNVSNKIVDNIVHNKRYLVNIIDLKLYDDYTYHHSLSVSVLATSIGISLKLSKKSLYELSLCGILHDIGKIQIPHYIIAKPSKLTFEEFDIIKEHPPKGSNYLIKNRLVTENIYNGVMSHHEKYDGTGYPYKLKGDQIPLFGRIIAIADVYDALTSDRPYRKSVLPSEAIEYIMGNNGIMFDPKIVKAFLMKIAPYPVNECVKLSDGNVGIVTKVYSENPIRPVVKLLNNTNKIYDLYNNLNLMNVTIVEII
ncbi:HD-GYP domain-containing protein [Sedimentibacter sp. zth1]|uniref:HD-GYP domain-containing protein n=1 Tax=Sedimentibacter sp. zth1 TaxID=2816908 RepID=UPI001A913170|nr:HD-GYP domain-containing protein [Sedimentibacter sp. zth1]QSX07136.1 HD-GYP domain-containing protein [Sedimentibacter sp. zth1]